MAAPATAKRIGQLTRHEAADSPMGGKRDYNLLAPGELNFSYRRAPKENFKLPATKQGKAIQGWAAFSATVADAVQHT